LLSSPDGVRLKIYNVQIKALFGFFAVAALSIYFGYGAKTFLAAVVIHELGHLAAMAVLSVETVKIELKASGIYIHRKEKILSSFKEGVVLLSGPAIGFAAAVLMKDKSHEFFRQSVILSAVNMLPIKGTDGGSLLRVLLPETQFPKADVYIEITAALALAAAFIITAAAGRNRNAFFMFAFMLLCLRAITEYK